jgi:hypothetical protein
MMMYLGDLRVPAALRQERSRRTRPMRAQANRGLRIRVGQALIAAGTALAGTERPMRHAPTRPAKPAHQHG